MSSRSENVAYGIFENIKIEKRGPVGLLQLDRPKALNALNEELSKEVLTALRGFDQDESVGAIVITGSEKAFAAGADIKEMQPKTFVELHSSDYFGAWDRIDEIKKPIIAAVNGFALGGGCELAMLCDFIIAGEGAKFGQPEIKLGILPGIGGTQRLTKLVGRAMAMDLILTGRMIDAHEAKLLGLVSRIVATAELLDYAIACAAEIAAFSPPAVKLAKEAVHYAEQSSLSDGILHERRLFQALFSTEGQKEGMSAFLDKRTPVFTGK